VHRQQEAGELVGWIMGDWSSGLWRPRAGNAGNYDEHAWPADRHAL
jgi:hypothetical protein